MTSTITHPASWRNVIIGPAPAAVTTSGRAAALVQSTRRHPSGLCVYDHVSHKTYKWDGVIESFDCPLPLHAMVRVAFGPGEAKLVAVPVGLLTRLYEGEQA